MDVIFWLQAHIDQILVIGASIISAASAIAAITPTPADDTFVGKLYKVLDILALNFGKAKDTPADTAEKAEAKDEKGE